ncbi:MAG: hypothetical protein GX133_06220, partial [Syntrophomonadaceae bacterium]|nr:hypothetical protein [Syntrophomonadaceae bacterium]
MKSRLGFWLATAILIVAGALPALHSDKFIIGAYSSIINFQATGDANSGTIADSIATKAQEAGFNALICKSAYEISEDNTTSRFVTLNNNNLDAIHEDWIFYPNPDPHQEKYGYTALSSGIDMKFEAEYANALNVNHDDQNSDTFFYMSAAATRVGNHEYHLSYSNKNYWSVPDGSSGYAYRDISYRWSNGDSYYDRVGKEFMFLGETTNNVSIVNNNTLNIRFVFRADGLEAYDYSDTLAVFSFVTYSGMTTQSSIPDTLFFYHPSSSNAIRSFALTKSVYETLAVIDISTGCKALEFQFPLQDDAQSQRHTLASQGLISSSGFNMQLSKSLNPWLYWNGRGNLKLDYVEYYDDIFANYTANPERLSKLRSYTDVANLRHFQGLDEPKAPNFESFNKLKRYLQTTFPVDERYLVAAINLDHSNLIKPDTNPYRLPISYLDHVNPRKIMIDVYPFTGEYIRWNDANLSNFVQNFLTKVCAEYQHFREHVDANTDLIFIPQTFGDYSHDVNKWIYLLPPAKTARCLQLLPLCYKPDGVVSFKFDSTIPNPLSARVHYALAWRNKNTAELRLQPQYYEVQEANSKLSCYGPIVRSLSWIDSQTINTDITSVHNVLYLDSLRVIYQENDPHYQGYIQAGFYTNDSDSCFIMCVNRRTDHALTDEGNLNTVAPEDYNSPNISIPHESQTLCIVPSPAAHTLYGTHLALFDTFDDSIALSESGKINVDIDPGDGRLLQMCSTLPALVTNNTDIKNIAYLSGSITIDQGAEVTIHPGTKTKIFANSTILVTGGSTLNISGNVDIADSVSIIVESGSNVIFNDATCNWGVDSYLQVDDSGITATNTILQNATTGNTWRGLRITNADTIDMTNTTITGARSNEVTNSQVQLTDCRFNIPNCGSGLTITNSLPSHSVRITSTVGDKGFYSMGA